MGFRFRKSFKILPGLRLNLGKTSVSVSAGVRGAHVTGGTTGSRATVGLPGTGLSYTEKLSGPTPAAAPGDGRARSAGVARVGGVLIAMVLLGIGLALR